MRAHAAQPGLPLDGCVACQPPSAPRWRRPRRRAQPALAFVFAVCLTAGSTAASAFDTQAPIDEASAEDLVMLLGGALPNRAFARTALPDARTNLCRDTPRRTAATESRSSGTRTLEVIAAPAAPASAPASPGQAPVAGASDAGVSATEPDEVPYAGDATPGVHLNVRFAFGSDRLSAVDVALLDNLAVALRDDRLVSERFAVAGHTDAVGPGSVNLALSCARALAVVRHLQAQGVAPARLSAYGFGSSRLLPGEAATAAVHRRVEIRRAP